MLVTLFLITLGFTLGAAVLFGCQTIVFQGMHMEAQEVIHFWFETLEPEQWWIKDSKLDALITERFEFVHARAACCELWQWRKTAIGRLAEIIVLDQFSRNMFRDTAKAFDFDPLALMLAQEAIAAGVHESLTAVQRGILYLPFMHSESALIHTRAEVLYQENGLEEQYQFELRHKSIIDRFGRYPHRNRLLGRKNTKEETAFLALPGSSF